MQYKSLSICVLFVLNCSITGAFAQSVHFQSNTGEQNQYKIETIQKITFSASEITVAKTDGADEIFAISDLQHVSFPGTNTSLKPLRQNSKAVFTLFPNPTFSHVIIKASNGKKLNGAIQILSITGHSVLFLNVSEETEKVVDISNLKNGIYLCRYRSAEHIQTIKLIKQ